MTRALAIRGTLISLAVVLVLSGVMLAGVTRPYVLSTGSMERTLLPGDYFLVRPLSGAPLQRGEIVQMRYPVDPSQTWIKRIAAIGGDHVRFHDKTLILNGSPVTEPYAIHTTSYIDPFRDNFPAVPNFRLQGNWADTLAKSTVNGELVVPEGKFFVLGDNRDNSLDSRYFGFVDRAYIIGKPLVIYFSADPAHRSGIRWQRMFHMF